MTSFAYGATTLTFKCDPVRDGNGQQFDRRQVMGRYSDGSVVVYDKSSAQRGKYTLQFTRISAVVLADLLSFFALVEGIRYPFTWTDHLAVVRSVKFAESNLNYTQTGPDRYTVSITLNEDDLL